MSVATIHTTRPVTETDRLGITLFFAVALHAVIILGVSFDLHRSDEKQKEKLPSLEVTLVHTKSNEKPEEADYLAQSAQQGSGNTQERVRPQSPQESMPGALPSPGDAMETTPPAQQAVDPQPVRQDAMTIAKAQSKILTGEETPQEQDPLPTAAKLIQQAIMTAKLEAELAEARKVYSKSTQTKTKFLVPNSASAVEAAYLDAWQKKVELVGNMNYPEKAKRDKLSGELLLVVTIKADGTLADDGVKLLRSSGHKLLDDAARRIVKLAAPFPPFPENMRSQYDVLQIPRVWKFMDSNTLRTQ